MTRYWFLLLFLLTLPLLAAGQSPEDKLIQRVDQFIAIKKELTPVFIRPPITFPKPKPDTPEEAKRKEQERQEKIAQAATEVFKLVDPPGDGLSFDLLAWLISLPAPAVQEKAGELFVKHQYKNARYVEYLRGVGQAQPLPKGLLEKVVDQEAAARDLRGELCMRLANYGYSRARPEGDAAARAMAEKYAERLSKEFGDVKYFGGTLKQVGENNLQRLRELLAGKPAPEIAAEDLDGKQVKLSDFKGKVVFVHFWNRTNTGPAYILNKDLLKKYPALVYLNVLSDRDRDALKKALEKDKFKAPGILLWDGPEGANNQRWHIIGTPEFLIDARGVVRFQGPVTFLAPGMRLRDTVLEELLKEAEKK